MRGRGMLIAAGGGCPTPDDGVRSIGGPCWMGACTLWGALTRFAGFGALRLVSKRCAFCRTVV